MLSVAPQLRTVVDKRWLIHSGYFAQSNHNPELHRRLCLGTTPAGSNCGTIAPGNLCSRHAGNGEAVSGQQHKGLVLHYPEKYLAQPVEKRRDDPQMVEIEVWDDVAKPSKDSHDLYLRKMEAEQVRAAIRELPVEFREIILLR